MTASFWIPFGSLAFLGLVNSVAVSFALGRLFQRVTQVEKEAADRASTSATVIELKVKMEHAETQLNKISATLEGVNRQLGNIAMNRVGMSGELK